MNRGKVYEDIAERFLKEKGFRVIKRNFRCPFGEIDIIAYDKDTLVFVEVKGGKTANFGEPAERINPKKLERIIRCAYMYMQKENIETENFRIDVVIVFKDKIEHIKNVGFF